MTDLNVATLSGNLVRDSELTTLKSGSSVLNMSIANNWSKKEGDNWVDEVNYFDLVMYGKRTETLANYLKKGTSVTAICKVRQERWEKDGKKASAVRFIVDDIKFGGARDRQKSESSGSNNPDGFPEDVPF